MSTASRVEGSGNPGGGVTPWAGQGLTTGQAAALLASHGRNELPAAAPTGWWRSVLRQLTHLFALMLWVAAALAFVAGMPALGFAIVVVVLLNSGFAYLQEARAERAAARLRKLMPSDVLVRRDGRPQILDAAELVPGDVVILSAGDRVPADLRFVTASGCTVDESMLTGEAEPVTKKDGDVGTGGTFLVNGEAEATVVATGADTRLAEITQLTAASKPPPSPLDRELNRVVRTISVIAVGVGVTFFLVSRLFAIGWTEAFLFAVGVTVALVPEGLLPTVTLSLAMGAQRMAGRNALVRNLQAVESLGAATFVCTDKTGTLTQNRMNVTLVWTPAGIVRVDGEGYAPVAQVDGAPEAIVQARATAAAALAASRGQVSLREGEWIAIGDPMEAAIDALARRLGQGPENDRPTHRWAFDPNRLRESALTGRTLCVKGAPEAVFALCDLPDFNDARARVHDLAVQGLRVLAVAGRELSETEAAEAIGERAGPERFERGLTLFGLLGLHDPPRATVAGALRQARAAGIKVAMLTGDHPATAAAIAREVGLCDSADLVLDGDDLPEDLAALGALLDRDGIVVSRVTPEQKLAVARALQARGHVVAMTGDGVNDGPALEEADVGVAMGRSGTDVARGAADLVLLDDDFATLIAAAEQGRAAYANVRRFLTYHLTDNVAELTPFLVWALTGGQFPLALGVLQILCLDIGTDILPAVALGSEQPSAGVMTRPPERRHLMDRQLLVRVFGLLGPTEALVEMIAFTAVLAAAGWTFGGAPPSPTVLAAASGAAFAAVVLGQVANAYACRSTTTPPWRLRTRNRLLTVSVVVGVTTLAATLLIPQIADVLGQAPPTPAGLAIASAAIPAVLLVDAIHKAFRRRSRLTGLALGTW